ncbi:MAG TPA: trypsin-like peptidase domain-containing protein [Anaerolineales bacterium]|nr:trypsin-like peptidase domain-containing protein [Anaerolineales bacterium]
MTQNILVELSDALADAAEKAGKATVLVNARRRMPASGIAYAADLVLTADHIVEREDDIKVMLADGTEIPAKVAGRDAGSDLAVLKLERAVAPVAEVTKSPARLGQIALVLGRPSPNGIEASLGTVSAIGGPIRTGRGGMLERYIRTDSISYPGFSGGPLVAADGTVLGINTSGLANGAAITIPAEIAWKIAETLVKHGRVKRGYLGIRSQTVEISAASQKALKREQATGLLIVGVENDSPASKGGFIVGDILVAVAGAPVLHHDELFTRLTGDVVDVSTGKSTPIEILRGGQPQTLNVQVGER